MGEEWRGFDDEGDAVTRGDLAAIFNDWFWGTSSGLVPAAPAL